MSNTITLSYTNDFKPVNNHIPPAQSLRIHCVSVRFNKEELAILNKNRGGFAPIFPDICYHLTHYKP
ncbi:hypothetical protein LI002_18750, partial [Escherichia coli]|nr:hypothetical protein [Escherichia coli]MCB6987452.1 hypothetical protein [Escherichia coli]MCB7000985.1 hypothetical protein [Escherichia coli]